MSTILIDLDHTLLNNTAFKSALAQSLELSQSEWKQAYDQFVRDNGTFEPKAFLQGAPLAQKKAFEQTVSKARQYLYGDSLDFLQRAHAKHYRIILVTFGQVAWQMQKLQALRLPAYVELLPTATTKIAVLADYVQPGTLVVDDNAAEIDALVQQWPQVKAYWITRSDGKYRFTAPTVPHTQISALSEIKF